MIRNFTLFFSEINSGPRRFHAAVFLLFFLSLCSWQDAWGQTTTIYSNPFNNSNGITTGLTRGTFPTPAGTGLVDGENGTSRGYEGYIFINPGYTFQPGADYKISLKARATGAVGTIRITRGLTLAEVRTTTAANTILATSNVPVSNSTFTLFEPNSFTVTSAQVLIFGIFVNGPTENNLQLDLDDFVITKTCNAPSTAITALGAKEFCQGGSIDLSVTPGQNYTYQWRRDGTIISGATLNIFKANTSGIYTVTVTNAAGCSATSTAAEAVSITVNTPPAAPTTLNLNQARCGDGELALTATPAPGTVLRWYDGSSGGDLKQEGLSYTVTAPGTYYVSSYNTTTNCESTTRTPITAVFNKPPTAEITSNSPESPQCQNLLDVNGETAFALVGSY